MKKFIKNLSIFIAIILVICLLFSILDIFVVKNQYSQGYTAALVDKIDRLKSIKEPKIIILGDSNLAFGINSKIIEEELKMPVINMGLHGGIGDAYYEALVKPYISEGDIIIIAPYVFEGYEYFPNKGLAMTTLEKNEDLWAQVNNEEKLDLLKAYPYYAYSCFAKWITFSGNKGEETSYSRDAFNEYGDVVKRPELYNKSADALFGYEGVIKIPKYNSTFFNGVNEFNKFVKSKGATLLFSAYPVANCEYTPSVEKYEEFQEILKRNIDCPIISKYEDYFMPTEYFYDTILHLTQEGADIRSKQLIKDIKEYMNSN